MICTSAEKSFFDGSAAVVHVADDLLQKTRFFENNRFSGSCIAALVTLGKAERSSDEKEDLFDQLLAVIKKVPHLQVLILPPPPFPSDAYVYQAKQLRLNFPDTYEMTDSGGSLLQVSQTMLKTGITNPFQIGRYGAHADRHLASGNKWDKDGILALKAYLVQVLGHHWLRKKSKANATFPLRQLHQMGVTAVSHNTEQAHDLLFRSGLENGPMSNLDDPEKPLGGVFLLNSSHSIVFSETYVNLCLQPESQPSTSTRPHDARHSSIRNDARLHSTRGGHITRHAAPARSGPRTSNSIDPQFLNDIISALQPAQQRRFQHNKRGNRK